MLGAKDRRVPPSNGLQARSRCGVGLYGGSTEGVWWACAGIVHLAVNRSDFLLQLVAGRVPCLRVTHPPPTPRSAVALPLPQYFHALKARGKTVKCLWFPEDEHGLSAACPACLPAHLPARPSVWLRLAAQSRWRRTTLSLVWAWPPPRASTSVRGRIKSQDVIYPACRCRQAEDGVGELCQHHRLAEDLRLKLRIKGGSRREPVESGADTGLASESPLSVRAHSSAAAAAESSERSFDEDNPKT